MLREISREEIAFVGGGDTTETYQDADSDWAVTFDDNGGWKSEVQISDNGGDGGWGYDPMGYDPGLFACLGGGIGPGFGQVGGACIGTNPIDLYVYGGEGTTGVDIQVGVATNTPQALTGEGTEAGMLVNIGQSTDGQHGTISISDPVPGYSHTTGYSVTEELTSTVSEAIGNISDWTYDEAGRPYDAPDD